MHCSVCKIFAFEENVCFFTVKFLRLQKFTFSGYEIILFEENACFLTMKFLRLQKFTFSGYEIISFEENVCFLVMKFLRLKKACVSRLWNFCICKKHVILSYVILTFAKIACFYCFLFFLAKDFSGGDCYGKNYEHYWQRVSEDEIPAQWNSIKRESQKPDYGLLKVDFFCGTVIFQDKEICNLNWNHRGKDWAD